MMQHHDVLVLGGGTGNLVADRLADAGIDVGLVEAGRLGGTCLNRGCNPSKKLIHRANLIEHVERANANHIDATVEHIDYAGIVRTVDEQIAEAAEAKARRARAHDHLTWYRTHGAFADRRTVALDDGRELQAERIVLAGGTRPMVPDAIEGTEDVEFLTSAETLSLETRPDHLVIVGGGYIAVELAHFFSRMGTTVTIVGRSELLLSDADQDIARQLTESYEERHTLHLGSGASALRASNHGKTVVAEDAEGETIEVTGDTVLLATGRRPNTDRWHVDTADIETDEAGFVCTDEALRTTNEAVFAIGDIAGNYQFKHSGDHEAAHVARTILEGAPSRPSYPGMAHAVFGSPQVASLGVPERELEDESYRVGRYAYDETVLGAELATGTRFVKVLVDAEETIRGCHIIGPQASTLIHEVSTAVAAGADAQTLAETIHVHPALSEVVQGAFREVCDVAPDGI